MKRSVTLMLILALGSLISGAVWAGKGLGTFQLTWPGYTTQWEKGEGLPGDKSQQGLLMQKNDPSVDNSGSQAVITGADGVTLTELGFDVRKDGVCGATPYFRVTTPQGVVHEFQCSSGTVFDIPGANDWKRVRFSAAAGLDAGDLRVVFTLPAGVAGFTYLDNLDVNETLIGKSGGGSR
jgi:hypothetical protein